MRKRCVLLLATALGLSVGCQQAADVAPKKSESQGATESVSVEAPKVVMKLPMTTNSESARGSFLSGLHANDMQHFVDANLSFENAIEADPNFALAYMMAGLTGNSTEEFAANLAKANEYAAAASQGEQLFIEGWQHAFDGDLEAWAASAAELAALHADSPRALMNHATALTALLQISEARKALADAIALEPTFAAAHMAAGNNYMNQLPKDFDRAAAHFQTAVDLEPDEATPYDLLGDVHRAQGNLEAAYVDYTMAAERAPELGSPLQQRGHVSSFLGDYDAARADYTRAIELENARGTNNGPFFAVFRAYVSLHEDKPTDAIAELRTLIADIKGSGMDGEDDLEINALTNIVQIATHYRDYDAAAAAIDELAGIVQSRAAVIGNPDFTRNQEANIIFARGMLAARQADQEAVAALSEQFQSTMVDVSNPRKLEPMHFFQGMASYEAGDCAATEAHLAQADQTNVYVRYHRALCFDQTDHSEAAQELYAELAVYNFNGPYYAMIRRDVLDRLNTSE